MVVGTELQLTQLEQLQTPCDMGRLLEWTKRQDTPNCDKPAEWSAIIHDCHMGQPVLLCTSHLAAARRDPAPQQFIKGRCTKCRHMYVSMDEVIWSIRRL